MANEQQRKHPRKRKAMQSVRDGVRRGHISKPSKCSGCGKSIPRGNLAGHHTGGYGNRRQVKWLCHKCHSAANRRTKDQSVN